MDPVFFTVRTPRARTHPQQLACMHERTSMHEPACMLAAAAAACAAAATASTSSQHQPANMMSYTRFLSPPRARPLKTASMLYAYEYAACRVTNDHGCCPVFQILAEFSPNNQNQLVAGCSVFRFAGGENFSEFRASGRDQALRSRPGPPVATKALSSPTPQMRGPHGRFKNFLEGILTPTLCH